VFTPGTPTQEIVDWGNTYCGDRAAAS
jgi:hypothetical protein